MDEKTKTNLCKFPQLLREAFNRYDLSFPATTNWEYKDLFAYRAVVWNSGREPHVTPDDFKSFAEMKKLPRGIPLEQAASDPAFYGVSLFTDPSVVRNLFKFPNPKKRMACGYVTQDGGPINIRKRDGHVTWWLYDGTEKNLEKEFRIENE